MIWYNKVIMVIVYGIVLYLIFQLGATIYKINKAEKRILGETQA